MNRGVSGSETRSGSITPASASSGTASPQISRPRIPIEVDLFEDRRQISAPEAASPGLLDSAGRIEVSLITRLFLIALRRAGYNAETNRAWIGSSNARNGGSLALQGQVWAFEFRTAPSALLDVDLSLVLLDRARGMAVWEADFPAETEAPLWVEPECSADEALSLALAETEFSAESLFSAPRFARAALKSHREPAVRSSHSMRDTHVVVPAGTWTSTEKGEIQIQESIVRPASDVEKRSAKRSTPAPSGAATKRKSRRSSGAAVSG